MTGRVLFPFADKVVSDDFETLLKERSSNLTGMI